MKPFAAIARLRLALLLWYALPGHYPTIRRAWASARREG
uniref:Uncharacterized protein n=1 Tax=Rhodocyclus tenuis TaxID=1066 RepID=A0A840G798_RHOTE|nr:hypothetical protein [Rhodocyclus tenuis]